LIFDTPYPATAPTVIIEAERQTVPLPSGIPTDPLQSGTPLAEWVAAIERALLTPPSSGDVHVEQDDSHYISLVHRPFARRWKDLLLIGVGVLLLLYKLYKSSKISEDG
jgi:hypothetical protein